MPGTAVGTCTSGASLALTGMLTGTVLFQQAAALGAINVCYAAFALTHAITSYCDVAAVLALLISESLAVCVLYELRCIANGLATGLLGVPYSTALAAQLRHMLSAGEAWVALLVAAAVIALLALP